MNAISPPPRRAHGTGSVFFHPVTRKWRYRLPGGRVERGGFATPESAAAELDVHLAGRDPRVLAMREHLRRALDLGAQLGISVDRELAAARTQRLIDWAKGRRKNPAEAKGDL